MGAKLANPHQTVFNIAGDGCFRMNLNELATLSRYNIPVIQVVMNNQVLGMVRQWQTLFYGQRYSNTILEDKVDFCKVAEGLGCKAIRVFKPEDIAPAFEQAKILMAQYRVPVVVEVILERVTNISMGSELDNVMEFEDIADNAADAPTETCFMHYE